MLLSSTCPFLIHALLLRSMMSLVTFGGVGSCILIVLACGFSHCAQMLPQACLDLNASRLYHLSLVGRCVLQHLLVLHDGTVIAAPVASVVPPRRREGVTVRTAGMGFVKDPAADATGDASSSCVLHHR